MKTGDPISATPPQSLPGGRREPHCFGDGAPAGCRRGGAPVAFALTDYTPTRLAWISPLPTLAVGGFLALLPPAALFLLLFPAVRNSLRPHKPRLRCARAPLRCHQPTIFGAPSPASSHAGGAERTADELRRRAIELRASIEAARSASPPPAQAILDDLVHRAALLSADASALEADQQQDQVAFGEA